MRELVEALSAGSKLAVLPLRRIGFIVRDVTDVTKHARDFFLPSSRSQILQYLTHNLEVTPPPTGDNLTQHMAAGSLKKRQLKAITFRRPTSPFHTPIQHLPRKEKERKNVYLPSPTVLAGLFLLLGGEGCENSVSGVAIGPSLLGWPS